MTERRLILSSENTLFREGLKRLLASSTMTVVGEVRSLSEVLPLLNSLVGGADLIVCDLPEKRDQEFAALTEVSREFPKIGTVLLAKLLDLAGFDSALAAGARGFLPKDISPAALRISLELILVGENIVAAPTSLATSRAAMSGPLALPAVPHDLRTPLTSRESQILNCLEMGQPNKVIASHLGMAESTVKVHVKGLMRKINVQNRTQAAVWRGRHTVDSSLDGFPPASPSIARAKEVTNPPNLIASEPKPAPRFPSPFAPTLSW